MSSNLIIGSDSIVDGAQRSSLDNVSLLQICE